MYTWVMGMMGLGDRRNKFLPHLKYSYLVVHFDLDFGQTWGESEEVGGPASPRHPNSGVHMVLHLKYHIF